MDFSKLFSFIVIKLPRKSISCSNKNDITFDGDVTEYLEYFAEGKRNAERLQKTTMQLIFSILAH